MLRLNHIGMTFAVMIIAVSITTAAVAQGLADPIPQTIEKSNIRIELQLIADGLAAPNLLTHAGDNSDRQFIVDQAGQVRLIKNGVLVNKPFLDVSNRLVELGFFGTKDPFTDFDERGLLGLAFHPGYADTQSAGYRKLYTYTSEPGSDFGFPNGPNHTSVITEWRVDDNDADMVDVNTRREIMRIDQPQFNHNAGMLAFGADGYLYASLGDGGSANDSAPGHSPQGNAQDTANILGSIIRIDPIDPALTPGGANAVSANGQYRIPDSNPFVADPQERVQEIFAYGLRNPFRFSFDQPTNRLIVADVGQNDVEEVSIVQNGDNLGWRIKEGTFLFDVNGLVTADSPGAPANLVDPVVQYDHNREDGDGDPNNNAAEGLSAIGGFVYRGSSIPELEGLYLFGDFSQSFFNPSGRLFIADLPGVGETAILPEELTVGFDDRGLIGPDGQSLFVKGFGQDGDGELYLLAGDNLGPFGDRGLVYKIVAVPEPGAMTLLIGAGALLSWRRRRAGCSPGKPRR